MRIVRLTEDTKKEALEALIGRNPSGFEDQEKAVREIIEAVRTGGDKALFAYEKKFDKCELTGDTIRVTREEIEEAYGALDPEFVNVLKKAAANIRDYHEKQKVNSWITTREDGVILGQKITPIEVSGCYVPGGRAAYPSSVLMNVVPAKVAGVSNIIVTTPPGADGRVTPGTIVAADIAGADAIYKCGGAQAIAAMAYGTESIPRADKITGPGNIYVALAKKACFGVTGIDSVAGPSEILVIADETANPRFVAADLLSQAEHDPMASAILLTTSMKLAEEVSAEIDGFLKTLSRAKIIEESLESFGYIFVSESMDDLIDAANTIASEHLARDPYGADRSR
ncbi:MAG: histidinol dehydrogenase [Lachnospiraceae bacterium]|nr:histidinol dehydrogenase [Lachnospiraceae bacterium]